MQSLGTAFLAVNRRVVILEQTSGVVLASACLISHVPWMVYTNSHGYVARTCLYVLCGENWKLKLVRELHVVKLSSKLEIIYRNTCFPDGVTDWWLTLSPNLSWLWKNTLVRIKHGPFSICVKDSITIVCGNEVDQMQTFNTRVLFYNINQNSRV